MSWMCDAHPEHPAEMVLTELSTGTVSALCMPTFLEAMSAMLAALQAAGEAEPEPAPEPLGEPLPFGTADQGEEVTPATPPAAEPTPDLDPAGGVPHAPGTEEPEPAEEELAPGSEYVLAPSRGADAAPPVPEPIHARSRVKGSARR